jgi:hypothetical protein
MSALFDRSDRRSAIAAMLLPAILLGVCYAWWIRGASTRQIHALERDIGVARAAVPTPAQEAQLTRELEDLRRRRDELRTRLDLLRRGGTRARLAERPDAAVRTLRTAEILAQRGIALEEELTEELNTGGPLSAAAHWANAHGLGGARVRRLTLRGRYLDVLAALSEITGPDVGGVPLHLSFRRAADGKGGLVWTLVLA